MKNILYINPLPENLYILDMNTEVPIHIPPIPFENFAEEFPHVITSIFEQKKYDEIWLIAGPGPFTKMRIVILALNTVKYLYPQTLFRQAHLFQLIPKPFFPILEVNNREYLIKNNTFDKICRSSTTDVEEYIFINKENIEKGNYMGYIKEFSPNFHFSPYRDTKENIIQIFQNLKNTELFHPIYFKNPHIVCPKK